MSSGQTARKAGAWIYSPVLISNKIELGKGKLEPTGNGIELSHDLGVFSNMSFD